MLFRKKITRSCSYCYWGTAIEDDNILCAKKGTVSACSSCRKFRYNPLKRIPLKMKTPNFKQYDDVDFTL